MQLTGLSERPVSKAAVWARRLAWFSAVLFVTAGAGHRYALLETPGFLIVLAIVATLACLALVVAAFGFSRLWNHGDLAGRDITAATVLATLVLAPFGLTAYRAVVYPALTDISTDLDDPPEFSVSLHPPSPGMNVPRSPTSLQKQAQLDGYPEITGRRYELPFSRVLDAVNIDVKAEGWTVLRPGDPAAGDETTIEAVAHTPVVGFPSDVAIRLTDEGDSTYVDMRSASRYGDRDFGGNAARIAAFLDQLDVDISALAGILPAEPSDDDPDEIPVPEPRPSG